jgi:long-chain acyl-CoA synthetase
MNSPLEYFLHWEKNIPDAIAFRQPKGDTWKTWTWKEAGNEIRRVAQYLKERGLVPGDHVALLSKNCTHWIMGDLAIMMAGCVSIPLYPTLPAESIQQILEHSDSKAIIIGKLDNYKEQKAGIPSSLVKIGVNYYGLDDGVSWENIVQITQPLQQPAIWKKEDLLTIMYTSGTTGSPKGVMHVAGSFDETVRAAHELLQIPAHPRVFSYLPLSHIAERLGIENMGLYRGGTFSFPETLDSFPKNLADTQPDYFIAVPRIWAKFQEKILEKMPQKKLDRLLSIPLVSTIVRNAIKKKLGLSKAKIFASGAAPASVSLLEWWKRLGVEIYQIYGMTEDCVFAHFNSRHGNKFGTVGRALPGLQAKLDPATQEIRVKSNCNMRGYYKQPELTAEMFDEEGYLKTGDTGEFDSEGYLTIIGRVKDQFKTDKGKYISPAPIEMKLSANADIEQVCVVGMGIPQPIALVVLSAIGKAKSKEEIVKSLSDTMDGINPHLEPYERLETAVIMKDDWTIENGLLTPSMKLKRNVLEKIHVPKYLTWYHQTGRVIWE